MLSLRVLKSNILDQKQNAEDFFQCHIFNFASTLTDYRNTEICETEKKKN